jgi:methionine sulfoxide reductase heme-binding subunit
MTYRGLPRRTRPLLWAVTALLIVAALAVTASDALAAAARWLGTDSASLPWFGSRLLGFLAYGALTASVVYGLLLSSGILDAIAHRAVSFALHQELAALGLALSAVHGALLALDTTVPTSIAGLLIPFAGGYRPIWVGLGQLALLIGAVVYASFSLRRLIGHRAWRLVHYATFLAFVGATAHGLMAGSDTPQAWSVAVYATASAAVVFLFIYRVFVSASRRFTRPLPAQARRPTRALD